MMKAKMMAGGGKAKMAAGGGMMKKGYASGGMPMVEKDGKKVPAFAADGKGKMAKGGRIASKGEHSVQTKSKRGAEMVKMAEGGKVKKMRMGGESTAMRDERAEAAGRRVAKDIEYDERMKKGGMTKAKMMAGGGMTSKMAPSKMGKVPTGKPSMGSASSRADGIAQKGLTKGRMLRKGGRVI